MQEQLKYAGLTAVIVTLLGAVVPLLTAGKLYEGMTAGIIGLAVLGFKAFTYK